MYSLYNLLLSGFGLAAFPVFLTRVILRQTRWGTFAQKFGFLPPETAARMKGSPRIWIHAVSMGEVSAVHPLIRKLRQAYPGACLMVSTGTESGQKVARERVSEATGTFFFPLDFPFAVRKFLGKLRPDLFITAETELWPNFSKMAKKAGAELLLVNGRISDRSFPRYRKTRFFWTAVLDHFDALSMIRIQDGERIISVGADPLRVQVNGNCKFDQAALSAEPKLREEMKSLLGLEESSPVFAAGSTHEGEEEAVIQAYCKMRERYPDLLLLLVPRHIERAARVDRILENLGIRDRIRRSRLEGEGRRGARVVLWDTFGELFKVYSVAHLVFCGGSLVPRRGQNILEPAAWGKVVLYGPSVEDFLDAHQLLAGAGAGIMVRSGDELAERGLHLLAHPQELKEKGEAGREALLAQCGASQRNLDLVGKLLAEKGIRS